MEEEVSRKLLSPFTHLDQVALRETCDEQGPRVVENLSWYEEEPRVVLSGSWGEETVRGELSEFRVSRGGYAEEGAEKGDGEEGDGQVPGGGGDGSEER